MAFKAEGLQAGAGLPCAEVKGAFELAFIDKSFQTRPFERLCYLSNLIYNKFPPELLAFRFSWVCQRKARGGGWEQNPRGQSISCPFQRHLASFGRHRARRTLAGNLCLLKSERAPQLP